MNRRSFLNSSLVVGSAGILVSTSPFNFASEIEFPQTTALTTVPTTTQRLKQQFFQSNEVVNPGLSRRQWKTIVLVQEHLFPSESFPSAIKLAPGAKDVNSKAYLYAVLADKNRDEADRKLVKQGIIDLQDISWNKYHLVFDKLTAEQREIALRELEKKPQGRPFIMTILGYIFEALLVDPVYGGNPDMIGWQWLEHQAGLPRPTSQSKYFLL